MIVREPPARCLGEWRGEDGVVALVEDLGMRNKGVEITGRELLVGKRIEYVGS